MSTFNEKPLGRGEIRVKPEADGKLNIRFGHFSRFPVGGLFVPAETFLTIGGETKGPLDTLVLAGQDDPEAVALVVKQLRELQAQEADDNRNALLGSALAQLSLASTHRIVPAGPPVLLVVGRKRRR